MPALLTAIFLASALGHTGELAGEYRIKNEIAGNVSEMTCTFTQKETSLTGTCVTEQGMTSEIAGNTQDDKVDWVFKSLYEGNPITLTYKGTLSDGSIRGSVTVEEFSVTGDFMASPVPKK
jgi:hypothetical protein